METFVFYTGMVALGFTYYVILTKVFYAAHQWFSLYMIERHIRKTHEQLFKKIGCP